MNKIKLVTDSTSDLRPETYKAIDAEVVPLLVNFGEESLRDRIEITLEQLFARVAATRIFPKTSSVPPAAFIEVFTKYIDQGYDILYIGIGRELSQTYTAAVLAAEEVGRGKICIVDSANLSSATGGMLMHAAEMRDQGLSIDEIVARLEILKKKQHTFFAVENLEFLYRGGRVSGTKYVFGTMMRVHPIIKVTDGKLGVYKAPKGKMVKALDEMLAEVAVLGFDNIDLGHVMVTHAHAPESAKYLIAKLADMGVPKDKIYESVAGSVIGTHCGPNTVGVLFIEK